ncbi:DNA translocase FtsK [Amphritea sp. HPY]|uniref:DNA translocase FtsK n=1 Tax=Amphritea sp. HPY TaxID=3421652 RepID=UPI003D7D71C8
MSQSNEFKIVSFADVFARIAKEGGLIILLGLAVFMQLALIGYDNRDSGWSHLGYHPEARNFTGQAGAWIADFLISIVGVGAYLIPLMLVVPAIRFMLRRRISLLDGLPFMMLRLVGGILILCSLATLSATHLSNQMLNLPFSMGGLIGQAVSDISVELFSLIGSSVVLWTVLLFGLTLFLELSWTAMLDSLGRVALKSVKALQPVSTPKIKSGSADKGASDPYAAEDEAKRSQLRAAARKEPDLSITHSSKVMQSSSTAEPAPGQSLESESFTVDPLFTDAAPPLSQTLQSPDPRAQVFDKNVEPATEVASDRFLTDPTAAPWGESAQELDPLAEISLGGAELNDSERKELKIVPLSETHVPMKDNELGLDHVAPAIRKRQPRRKIPSMDLLDAPELKQGHCYTDDQLEQMSRLLESKLKDFGIVAEVVEVNPGPVITRFELQPAPGVKASRITNLARDLARSMAVMSVRVVEVIAGKSVIGIEIPNEERQMVRLSEVLNSKPYKEASSKLTLGLGNDIAGNPVVANLAKMPHLLVAGTTGSGKSVGVNAMLLSLLFKATPDEVRLMLVDPKMLELSIYEGIPHLLAPVITDMKEAAGGLRWCVAEMENRYRVMAKMGVRNIAGYNEKIIEARDKGEPLLDPLWNPEEQGLPADSPAPYLETLPYIVVCIDEFADMMMVVGKKVEELIARIAQKARAAGIHLILATQRPSVDVITGLIKANIPTRIGFQVSSKIDSRTVLDQSGAEHLLGNGDMLYLPAGSSLPNRVHGAFVSDDEVHRVVEAWKKLGAPEYLVHDLSEVSDAGSGSGGSVDDEQDPLYDEAVAFVTETRKASISSVQRKLKIGYNRAARMIETMEASGVITPAGHNGAREVLAPPPPKN